MLLIRVNQQYRRHLGTEKYEIIGAVSTERCVFRTGEEIESRRGVRQADEDKEKDDMCSSGGIY